MGALRTLVVIEPGRAGDAAVEEARAHAGLTGCDVTVVGAAPQVAAVRCGPSGADYNGAVVDAVVRDLTRACDRLATADLDVTCRVLVDGRDPPLEQFAAAGGFGLILLPSRRPRWRPARHPSARRLSSVTQAEVRLVGRP
jgi:nucleotide-binding universal stress UspA family protein